MTRVLQTLALALLVLGLGGRAAMAGKGTVVILGLEVIDKGLGIDQQTTQLAKDFTTQLRNRASQAGQLAAHSDKELIDEKLIRNCNTADPACIAPIGSELGAAYLIYGSIEKSASGSKISLHLLNVGTRLPIRHYPTELHDTSAGALAEAAKAAYAGLMGGDAGSINININNDGVDTGTVTIGKDKRQLQGGHLTIKDVSADRYSMTIDVTGFQRYEQTVTVGQGEKKEVTVTLVPIPGSKIVVPPKCSDGSLDCGNTVSHTHTNLWKPVFIGAAVIAVGSAGYWVYAYGKESDSAKKAGEVSGAPATQAACTQMNIDADTYLKSSCHMRTQTIYGIIGTAAGALIMGATLSAAWLHKDGEGTGHTMAGRRTHKPLIAITPIISPDGGGANVRIDF